MQKQTCFARQASHSLIHSTAPPLAADEPAGTTHPAPPPIPEPCAGEKGEPRRRWGRYGCRSRSRSRSLREGQHRRSSPRAAPPRWCAAPSSSATAAPAPRASASASSARSASPTASRSTYVSAPSSLIPSFDWCRQFIYPSIGLHIMADSYCHVYFWRYIWADLVWLEKAWCTSFIFLGASYLCLVVYPRPMV